MHSTLWSTVENVRIVRRSAKSNGRVADNTDTILFGAMALTLPMRAGIRPPVLADGKWHQNASVRHSDDGAACQFPKWVRCFSFSPQTYSRRSLSGTRRSSALMLKGRV